MDDYTVAKTAYEARRAYDKSACSEELPVFEEAEYWLTASYIKTVEWLKQNPTATVEDAHNARNAAVIKAGWKQGPFDPANKTHPLIVDYAELPKEQRTRDAIGFAVMQSLIMGVK